MLLGNRTIFHKLPVRFLAGSTTSFHSQSRSGFGQAGMRRNRFLQDGATVALNTYSYPQGTYAPSGNQRVGSAYILPQKAGAMASFYEASISITPTAVAYGGITTTGTATIAIDFAAATGKLIASGNGSAGMSLTFANALLTASLNGTGAAGLTITTNTPQLGALASGTGAASITMTFANAQALPLNDASPLRTGAASFAVTGSLTPYAIGFMSGSTDNAAELTAGSVASAVWAANAGDNNAIGTMGEKLNDAGSAANPWTEIIESGYTAAEILRLLASQAAGAATGLDGATTAFKSLDGTKTRVSGTVAAGVRTIDSVDAS